MWLSNQISNYWINPKGKDVRQICSKEDMGLPLWGPTAAASEHKVMTYILGINIYPKTEIQGKTLT